MKSARILGVILGGGAGSRIGGRKPLVELCGRPMIAHVAATLRAISDDVAVAGDAEAARAIGAESIDDPEECPPGPLAGVLAGMAWAERRNAEWLAVAPCDTPLLERTVFDRLFAEVEGDAALARTADGLHPLISIWRCGRSRWLSAELGGVSRPVKAVLTALGATPVWFDDSQSFMNVNTRDDLASATAIIEGAGR